MDNQHSKKSKMDVLENIKTIETLIGKGSFDDVLTHIDTLINYTHENIITLDENRQLKQQIADCLLLCEKKRLTTSPQKYGAYYNLAVSCFLSGDIQGLCQNMTVFFDEDKKAGGSSLSSDECVTYVLFFYNNLADNPRQIFLTSTTSIFEKNHPETAVTNYIKSLDITLDKDQLIFYLSKTIDHDKNFVVALSDIAEIFQDDKNWKNAISYYNRCIGCGVSSTDIYFDLAWCYGKIKDYNNEIDTYKKCLDIDPDFPCAMNNLGYAYEKSKDYEQALSCYQQAIKTDDNDVFPYRNIFRLLKKLKRYDEAVDFGNTNKKRLLPSCQNDIDMMKEAKDVPQNVTDDIEDETETVSAQQVKRSYSRTTGNSYLAESRLEDEIEARINRGLPFLDLSLKMYDNSDGYGRQYIIPGIGRIDLLTVNTANNDLYVIELKKGQGDDEIVGQVSRYMGWVKENLALGGQSVYGVICTAQASDRLKYAAEANPNIAVFNYSLNIALA